jgi:Fur family ferric uptake transcriptional regulator
VGRATVFRTLKLLQEVGTVCQVVLDDGTLQYRLTPGGHHHHIVCSRCGAVNDFASCDIQGLLSEIADRTGYAIDAHRLEVYGRCAACRSTIES